MFLREMNLEPTKDPFFTSRLMTLTHRRRPCHFHGNRLYFAQGWQEKLEDIDLVQGNCWDKLEPGEIVTRSKRTNTYKVTLACGETVYFKRYLLFGKPFKFYLRTSQAAIEVFSYNKMAKLGIPVAEPLALGEIRRFGSLFATCIVTKEIPETITLKEYAMHEWPFLPPQQRQKAFLTISATICRDLRIMHTAGFFHFDPKWRNILVRRNQAGKIEGLWWIDSPRGKRLPTWLCEYGIVHDLASLCRLALSFLSKSQRLRFLFAYCGSDMTRQEIKKLAGKITRHLQRNPPKPVKPTKRKSEC